MTHRHRLVHPMLVLSLTLVMVAVHVRAFSNQKFTTTTTTIATATATATTTTTTTTINSSNNENDNQLDSALLLREKLLSLLNDIPSNAPTSPEQTKILLDVIRKLEDGNNNSSNNNDSGRARVGTDSFIEQLSGPWELVWTTQDRSSDVYKQQLPFQTWINPLENQSYSNNPRSSSSLGGQGGGGGGGGRMNPVLPREIQDQLERFGIIDTTTTTTSRSSSSSGNNNSKSDNDTVKSTQFIDVKRGKVRNVVSFVVPAFTPLRFVNLVPLFRSSSTSYQQRRRQQRASLTIDIDFWPDNDIPNRVKVKFQSCRIVLPQSPIDVTLPLPGFVGPTGWLQTNYMDDTLRITRGHKGSVFILKRPSSSL